MSPRDGEAPTPTEILLALAAVVVIIGGTKLAAPVLVPFILSVFIATILLPPLHWLTSHRLPLPLAMVVLSLGIVAIWLPVGGIVGASFDDFYAALPDYQQRVQSMTRQVGQWLSERGVGIGEAIQDLLKPSAALAFVRQLGAGLGAALANVFLILLTVIFILLEVSEFPAKVRAALGDRAGVLETFQRFSASLQDYLRIKTLVSVMTGLAIAGWLWVVGLDFPMLWGVLAFLLNYVPNIGSIIAAVPAVLLAMVSMDLTGVLLVLLGYVAANTLFGNVIEPRLMGRGLGLSTLVVFLSLIFWGWVLGPVGMLLSGPLTMMIKLALELDPRTRWFAILLGSGESLRLADADPGTGDDPGA